MKHSARSRGDSLPERHIPNISEYTMLSILEHIFVSLGDSFHDMTSAMAPVCKLAKSSLPLIVGDDLHRADARRAVFRTFRIALD